MKKWLVSLALILCVLSCTACGSSNEAPETDSISAEEQQQWLDSSVQFVTALQTAVESGMYETVADDPVYGPAYEGFETAMEEIVKVEGVAGREVQVTEDGLQVFVDVDGSDHDAEVVIDLEKGSDGYTVTNIATNVIYSFKELMQQAGLNTILGMGITFCVLGILIAVISLFGLIPVIQSRLEARKAPAEPEEVPAAAAPARAPAQEPEEVPEDDTQLIAVITAAIAAYRAAETQAPADGFVVRSIRKSRKKGA